MAGDFIQQNWLALAMLLAAAACLAGAALSPARRVPLLIVGLAIALPSIGALFAGSADEASKLLSGDWGLGILLTSAGLLVALVLLLAFTGLWSNWVGYFVCAALLFGLGHVILPPLTIGINDLARILVTLEPLEPWWLLLLFSVPWLIWYSWRRLAALGPGRRVLAIALRCSLLTLLAFALAEMHARHSENRLTVLFVWDRSLSVPPEYVDDINLREERIKTFLNDAVAKRGPGKEQDRVGLVVFGKQPALELPPGAVPQLRLQKIQSRIDDTYTDIAAAIKLALASFPEGTGKRIVLMSDGNENLGNAEEQARIAKQNGVQIDSVPLAAGYKNENEVLVQSVEAPPLTEQGARLPIRVLVRNYSPGRVRGTLSLRQVSGDETEHVAIDPTPAVIKLGPPAEVILNPGLNAFSFKKSLAGEQRSY